MGDPRDWGQRPGRECASRDRSELAMESGAQPEAACSVEVRLEGVEDSANDPCDFRDAMRLSVFCGGERP